MKFLLIFALGVVASHAEQSQVLKDFHVGYNKFSANVYKELTKVETGSFLVCPLSANIILALAHDGANGITAEELSAGLNLPQDKEKINQIFRELTPLLEGNDHYNLYSANKIYVKEGATLNPEFKALAEDVFKAGAENIDFEKSEAAAHTVNKWVEEQTREKITELVDASNLDEYTYALLVNAMYFQGKWFKQFTASHTHEDNFHVNENEQVKVDMMEMINSFRYHDCPEVNATYLEMRYVSGNVQDDVSMVFVLPHRRDGLADLEEHIEKVLTAPPSLKSERVHVLIPKFKVETKIEFTPILENLGVSKAFSDTADFRHMTADNVDLKLSKITQKAFIEVEEKGTTAAAATAVEIQLTRAGHVYLEDPKEFKADHPFIYYITSAKAGVLFVGRYTGK